MKSEHDHWGEMRAIRKRLRRADRAGDKEARAVLWERHKTLSWLLDALIDAKALTRCDRCGGKLVEGYGKAGGGMGAYTCCTACHWFVKRQDPECSSE